LDAADGEAVTWLRPGEEHLEWTLGIAANALTDLPAVDLLWSNQLLQVDSSGRPVAAVVNSTDLGRWLHRSAADPRPAPIRLPFVRRSILDRTGGIDDSLLDAFDRDLLPRLGILSPPAIVPLPLGVIDHRWWLAARYATIAEAAEREGRIGERPGVLASRSIWRSPEGGSWHLADAPVDDPTPAGARPVS
jgi:hypothetical protein